MVYLGGNHLETINYNETPIFNEPYILYIGSREKYKNFRILIEALNKIQTKGISVVCFGGEKISKKEISENKSNIKINQIYGNDLTLLNLIKNAECFVNTSIYEGFSIPNLEAMMNDCPIICSDIPVFREICGVAASYFDEKNSEELAYKIDKLINSKDIRYNLIKNGNLRSKKFNWKACAKSTLEIYQNVLDK